MNTPDIVELKGSEADVVSAVLSGGTLTLTKSFQISLSACKDNGEAYEAGDGGALRMVGSFT